MTVREVVTPAIASREIRHVPEADAIDQIRDASPGRPELHRALVASTRSCEEEQHRAHLGGRPAMTIGVRLPNGLSDPGVGTWGSRTARRVDALAEARVSIRPSCHLPRDRRSCDESRRATALSGAKNRSADGRAAARCRRPMRSRQLATDCRPLSAARAPCRRCRRRVRNRLEPLLADRFPQSSRDVRAVLDAREGCFDLDEHVLCVSSRPLSSSRITLGRAVGDVVAERAIRRTRRGRAACAGFTAVEAGPRSLSSASRKRLGPRPDGHGPSDIRASRPLSDPSRELSRERASAGRRNLCSSFCRAAGLPSQSTLREAASGS